MADTDALTAIVTAIRTNAYEFPTIYSYDFSSKFCYDALPSRVQLLFRTYKVSILFVEHALQELNVLIEREYRGSVWRRWRLLIAHPAFAIDMHRSLSLLLRRAIPDDSTVDMPFDKLRREIGAILPNAERCKEFVAELTRLKERLVPRQTTGRIRVFG